VIAKVQLEMVAVLGGEAAHRTLDDTVGSDVSPGVFVELILYIIIRLLYYMIKIT